MKALFKIFFTLSIFLLMGNHGKHDVAYRETPLHMAAVKIENARVHTASPLLPTTANRQQYNRPQTQDNNPLLFAEEIEDDSLQWTLLKKVKHFSNGVSAVYGNCRLLLLSCSNRLPATGHFSYATTNRYLLIRVFRI